VVVAGTNIQLDSSPIAIVGPTETSDPATVVAPIAVANPGLWKIASITMGLGWLVTLLYLLISRKRPSAPQAEQTENLSEKKAFKNLLAACSAENAVFARKGIIEWVDTLSPKQSICSLEEVAGYFHDVQLSSNLDSLNNKLYSEAGVSWDSAELATVAQRLRKHQQTVASQSGDTLALYPA